MGMCTRRRRALDLVLVLVLVVTRSTRRRALVLVLVLVVTRSTKRSRAAVLRMRAKQINAEPDPSAMPIATRKHAQLGAAKGAPGKGEHAGARDAQRQRKTGRRVGRRRGV